MRDKTQLWSTYKLHVVSLGFKKDITVQSVAIINAPLRDGIGGWYTDALKLC